MLKSVASTAQPTRTDPVHMAAHYCPCVVTRINTETYRQVWRLQGDHQFKKNSNRSAFLSLLWLPLYFNLISVPENLLFLAFQRKWHHSQCLTRNKDSDFFFYIRSKPFNISVFHFDLIISSTIYLSCWLTDKYVQLFFSFAVFFFFFTVLID